MREMAGRIDLSSRGRIRVTGEDRARLLHAMTTNHIQNLVPGTGCYAFFLNAVGRVLADANVLCFDDYLLIDTEPESRVFLMEHLDKYIIADDVVLEDVSESTFSLGIEGPDAEAVLCKAGLPVPEASLSHVSAESLTVVRASSTGAPGFRVIGMAHSGAPGRDRQAPIPQVMRPGRPSAWSISFRAMETTSPPRTCRRKPGSPTHFISVRAATWGRKSWSGCGRAAT